MTLAPAATVVCNPPYVALRRLGDDRKNEAANALRQDSKALVPNVLKGKPNYHLYFWFYHLYFWFHGAQFLDDEGRLVFITSGEWLDSDFGAQLQRWLLENTVIELVIESVAETWFTEARVGTVVLCARRCSSQAVRDANPVKFTTLRLPLANLYGCVADEDDADHIAHVDALRDELLTLAGAFSETNRFDHSTITQADLFALGQR